MALGGVQSVESETTVGEKPAAAVAAAPTVIWRGAAPESAKRSVAVSRPALSPRSTEKPQLPAALSFASTLKASGLARSSELVEASRHAPPPPRPETTTATAPRRVPAGAPCMPARFGEPEKSPSPAKRPCTTSTLPRVRLNCRRTKPFESESASAVGASSRHGEGAAAARPRKGAAGAAPAAAGTERSASAQSAPTRRGIVAENVVRLWRLSLMKAKEVVRWV